MTDMPFFLVQTRALATWFLGRRSIEGFASRIYQCSGESNATQLNA